MSACRPDLSGDFLTTSHLILEPDHVDREEEAVLVSRDLRAEMPGGSVVQLYSPAPGMPACGLLRGYGSM